MLYGHVDDQKSSVHFFPFFVFCLILWGVFFRGGRGGCNGVGIKTLNFEPFCPSLKEIMYSCKHTLSVIMFYSFLFLAIMTKEPMHIFTKTHLVALSHLTLSGLTCLRSLSFLICAALKKPLPY